MKKIIYTVNAALFLILVNACAATGRIPSEKVAQLLNSGEFTFMAESANPTNSDVVNILNTLPASGSNRMLNLDYGYTIQLKKSELTVELPYFGRMYNPSYDPSKNSYRFTSKDFSLNEQAGKKESTVYIIQTADQPNIRRIIMEVFRNGKTYVAIDANDRAPITYDGYIMENTSPQK